MSVTEEELDALRKEAAEARENESASINDDAAATAERTRAIKAARLRKELGRGLDTRGGDPEAAPETVDVSKKKTPKPNPVEASKDDKSA